MIVDDVHIVSVPVSDQERAKNFYVDALALELREDRLWVEGTRWVEVAPESSSTSLSLVTWFEAMQPDSLQGLIVATDDIRKTYEEIVARGLPFDSPPRELPEGSQAAFGDPDGNGLVL